MRILLIILILFIIAGCSNPCIHGIDCRRDISMYYLDGTLIPGEVGNTGNQTSKRLVPVTGYNNTLYYKEGYVVKPQKGD